MAHHKVLRCRSILAKHAECPNGAKLCSKFYLCCIYDFVPLNGVISVTNAQLEGKKWNSLFTILEFKIALSFIIEKYNLGGFRDYYGKQGICLDLALVAHL